MRDTRLLSRNNDHGSSGGAIDSRSSPNARTVPVAGRTELERLAAGNVKRVFAAGEDWAAPPSPARMLAFLEIKTVWHPVGV